MSSIPQGKLLCNQVLKFLQYKVCKENNFPNASTPLAEFLASVITPREFTLPRHYSSFQAKWRAKQGDSYTASKWMNCSAPNSEEPTAEPECSWDIQVSQTIPLLSLKLGAPQVLWQEAKGLGKSQPCLKEFLVFWEANIWTFLSMVIWIWTT